MTENIVDMKDKRNLVHKQQITCQEDQIYGAKAVTTTKKKFQSKQTAQNQSNQNIYHRVSGNIKVLRTPFLSCPQLIYHKSLLILFSKYCLTPYVSQHPPP